MGLQLGFDGVLTTLDPLGDRLCYPCSESVGLGFVPSFRQLLHDLPRNRLKGLGVEGLLEQSLRALLADCLSTAQPRARQEHLLMKTEPRLSDENQARNCRSKRFLKAGNDDSGHSFQ